MSVNPEAPLNDKNIPVVLTESMSMTEANEKIKIHAGVFELRNNENSVVLDGRIEFQWFPALGGSFTGSVKSAKNSTSLFLSSSNKFDLYVDNEKFGECVVTHHQAARGITIGGVLNN